MAERLVHLQANERRELYPESYVEVGGVCTNPDSWPIQIRNGVISVDFGSGCLGCAWCITKRQAGRDIIQDTSYNNNLGAEAMLHMLSATRAFTEARLPLRIGNNTDGTLIPVPVLEEFYTGLPSDYPIALLTRGIHSSALNNFLADTGSNFILCRTVTPPHSSLAYKTPWGRAYESFRQSNCNKVLNIGPCAEETFEDTLAILESGQIPQGTRAIIAPLNRRLLSDDVLRSVTAKPITREQMQVLEETGRRNGLQIHRANNCAIADLTGRPSMEYGDINYPHGNEYKSKTAGTSNHRGLDSVCPSCTNYGICKPYFESEIKPDIDRLTELAASIGINEIGVIWNRPGLVVVDSPWITKAETSYLSGMLGVRVSARDSLAQPDTKAAERWMEQDFYPVQDAVRFGEKMDPLRLRRRS